MRERPITNEERERLQKLCSIIPQGVWYAVHVRDRADLVNVCSSQPSKYGNDFTPVMNMVPKDDPIVSWAIACADLVPALLDDFARLEKAIGHALSWLEGTYPERGPDAIDIQSAMRVLAAAWPGRDPKRQTLPNVDPDRIARLFKEDLERAQRLIDASKRTQSTNPALGPTKEVMISDLEPGEWPGDRSRHAAVAHVHRESEGPSHPPACSTCNDTHVMTLGEREVLCTHCPVPCGRCRTDGVGPYCKTIPCPCDCHVGSRR